MSFQSYWCMVGVILLLSILLSRKTDGKTIFFPVYELNIKMYDQVRLYLEEYVGLCQNIYDGVFLLIAKLVW